MKKSEIRKGAIVSVIDTGHTYIAFEAMANFFNMINWKSGRNPSYDSKYKIINFHVHLGHLGHHEHDTIVYIQDIETGDEFIIGHDGIMEIEIFIEEDEFSI